jgi:hypothetical protein
MSNLRFRCTECGWIGLSDAMLRAPHPFDPDDIISGCPSCKLIGTFVNLCDEDGCNQQATCGWPSPTGYRRTCYKHMKRGDI